MRKALREVIENILDCHKRNIPPYNNTLEKLREEYENDRKALTVTSKRIEFLQDLLDQGVSKREAARQLTAHDPRINQSTAETLVYTNFSGAYQTTLRGRRLNKPTENNSKPVAVDVPEITDDEALL